MPVEILLRITSSLTTVELGAVRLSCKKLEELLFSFFSREFFRKKQFMLSHLSLQTLIDISLHPALSRCLEHVIIATDSFNPESLSFVHHAVPQQNMDYCIGAAEQWALTNTGQDRAMLARAFSRLPNLHTVDVRDFNLNRRTRDGPHAVWTSYGATTVRQTTGVQLRMRSARYGDEYASHIFAVVLAALADAAARPANLELVIRSHGWGVYDASLYVPPWLEPSLAPVLANLTKLHLCVVLSQNSRTSSISPQSPPGALFLQSFLGFTPNLTWLRLNLQNSTATVVHEFLSWLSLSVPDGASPKSTSLGSPDPVSLPALEQLDLGNARINLSDLKHLISKFGRTLRGLSLVRIYLVGSHSHPHERVNLWADLIRWLSGVGRGNLRSFNVREPWQTNDFSQSEECFFQNGEDAGRSKERSYSGDDIGDFLGKLAKQVTVDWTPAVDTQSDSTNSEQDGEDGEDEDDGSEGGGAD